jgi:hypothetical protein
MRTSLNEIRNIDHFLSGRLQPEDMLLMDAQLLTDADLRKKVDLQRYIYRLISLFHRKQLRKDLNNIHHELFTSPVKREFQEDINKIFRDK